MKVFSPQFSTPGPALSNRAATSKDPQLKELEEILGRSIEPQEPVDRAPEIRPQEEPEPEPAQEAEEEGFSLKSLAIRYGAPTGTGILGGIAGVVAVGTIAGWWLPVVAGLAAGVGAAKVAHSVGAGKKAMIAAGVTTGLATAAASFTALKLAGFALGAVGGGAVGKFVGNMMTKD